MWGARKGWWGDTMAKKTCETERGPGRVGRAQCLTAGKDHDVRKLYDTVWTDTPRQKRKKETGGRRDAVLNRSRGGGSQRGRKVSGTVRKGVLSKTSVTIPVRQNGDKRMRRSRTGGVPGSTEKSGKGAAAHIGGGNKRGGDARLFQYNRLCEKRRQKPNKISFEKQKHGERPETRQERTKTKRGKAWAGRGRSAKPVEWLLTPEKGIRKGRTF